jgi:hypothetical protein
MEQTWSRVFASDASAGKTPYRVSRLLSQQVRGEIESSEISDAEADSIIPEFGPGQCVQPITPVSPCD